MAASCGLAGGTDHPVCSERPGLICVIAKLLDNLIRLRTELLRRKSDFGEHKVDLVLDFADKAYVMVNGKIVHAGPSSVLQSDLELQSKLLGVG